MKLNLSNITSGYGAVAALNANFDAIETAVENTLSRDGTTPNEMLANLDMNGNDILNANAVDVSSLTINGTPVQPSTGVTVASAFQSYTFTATLGQTSFSVTPYTPYVASVQVEVNGLSLPPADISVSGTNVVIPACSAGDEVVIRRYTDAPSPFPVASDITFNQAGTVQTRSVQSKLRDVVSVLDFGADPTGVANSAPALQSAINAAAGRPVYVPAGTYLINSGLIYDTSGDGIVSGLKLIGDGKYKTVINNASGGVAITCTSGNAITDFQYDMAIENLSITNSTASANTIGIQLSGVFQSVISNVRIVDQASHGLYLLTTIGDATDCSQIHIKECDFSDNGGWGVIAYGDPNAIHSEINVDACRVIANTLGGIAYYSVVNGTIQNTAIAYNGGVGVAVSHAGGPYSKAVNILNNEFDSNTGTQLQLGYVIGVTASENYFVCNTGAPAVTKQVDVTQYAQNVLLDHSQPRLSPGYTGVTMFTVASGAASVRVLNTLWQSWVALGNTKYSDAGTATLILDDGQFITPVRASGGVAFPATMVPSSNVNTLDDYEEGTWTTTVSAYTNFNATPTLAKAIYTKVGNLVHLEGEFSGTVTSTGAVSITFAVPFPTKNAPSGAAGVAVEVNQIAFGGIFDASSVSNDVFVMWFLSLNSGNRETRFSLTYCAA